MDIKVVVADDHEIMVEGLCAIIRAVRGIRVVGEALDGEELVRQVKRLKPDIIITDMHMPKLNGIEATKQIKAANPGVSVIGLSSADDEDLILDIVSAGAEGFLLKGARKAEIIRAVRKVFQGENYYCRFTKAKITEMLRSRRSSQSTEQELKFTEKELRIVQLVCAGMNSRMIASEVGLQYRTVERYRENIMKKMGVSNAAGLIIYAVKHKMITV